MNAKQVIPATVEFTDIAGLVRGANKGEGLGNQVLAHIRETAAIVHVVRCFEDADVTHVDGAVNPLRDVETIETELALADLETAEKRLDRVKRAAKAGRKEEQAEAAFFEGLNAHLSSGRPARSFPVPKEVEEAYRSSFFLTGKPVLFVANVDEAGLAQGNAHVRALEDHATRTGASVIRVCAKIEAELAELDRAGREEFLAALGLAEPGLDRLIRAAYTLLDLITFLTAGEKEVKAWTIARGTRAPQAAGTIHTDFERTFIRAEIIRFEDYVACGGEAGARAAGKLRLEGKDYEMQDGDVVHFRVGA
jgi:GTP-binding protein YchF